MVVLYSVSYSGKIKVNFPLFVGNMEYYIMWLSVTVSRMFFQNYFENIIQSFTYPLQLYYINYNFKF